MNTLKFKVLLIRESLLIFLKAVGVYLLITLPVLVTLPEMYELSALYAISFGWVAWLFFLSAFYFLQKIRAGLVAKTITLYVSVAAGVVIAFQLMEVTKVEYGIWQSGPFLMFPAVAIISGWISLAIARKTISTVFTVEKGNAYEIIASNRY